MKNLIGVTLGQYEIKQLIGKGGMAHVFKAYQPSLDRFVAIKVLSSSLTEEPGFTERFQREAHAIARLHHPNILAVYDYGVQDDFNYIVMHYVENSRTLQDLIESGASLDDLINYLVQIASALNYAHQQGVIHRDIKPGNILIESEWALLSDFGLVKVKESVSHLTGTDVVGTPAYMSPEQITGKGVDHRTDIYALGVILYKILTGTIPHDASTPIAILHKRTTEPVSPPHNIKPEIPESLEHVVLRSLAKIPDDRYSTATDFAAALKEAKTNPGFREGTVTNALGEATVVSNSEVLSPAPNQQKQSKMAMSAVFAAVILIILVPLLWFLVSQSSRVVPQDTPIPSENSASAGSIVSLSTHTPTPAANTPTSILRNTPLAVAQTRLEVRTGPGNEYDLLGYLTKGVTTEIIGKDEAGQWWQISTSLNGANAGWISAAGCEASNTDNVPIALAPSTPTPTSTPTPISTSTSTSTSIGLFH